MRFKVLDNGRVRDVMQNVEFDPRKQKNRIAALRFKEQGDSQLLDIIKRIDASEQNKASAQPSEKGMRLAGDGINALRGEIGEQELGPAYEALLDKAAEFNTIDSHLMSAGVPASQFSGMQRLQVPELQGNVPAPYIDKSSPGVEKRIHLVRDEDNRELYPIGNNNPEAGEFLVTEFGKDVNMEGQTKASEYVQDHILRLMGDDPKRGKHAGVDFVVERDGKTIGIDGQTQLEGKPPVVEAFTKVMPNNRAGVGGDGGGYGYGYARDGNNTKANEIAIKNDVGASLNNAMKEGRTFDEAMQFLMNDGYIADARDRHGNGVVAGKLYKSDYDEVLMPIQNAQQHIANARQDRVAIAPEGVVSYNIHDIKDDVKGITNPREILKAYNAGFSGRDQARVKLRAEVPSRHVHDVVAEHPYVGQMLRQLQYK